MLQGQEVSVLGHFVDDNENDIVTIGFGQSFDKIEAYCMPSLLRYW
jgi:hypothetical protein